MHARTNAPLHCARLQQQIQQAQAQHTQAQLDGRAAVPPATSSLIPPCHKCMWPMKA